MDSESQKKALDFILDLVRGASLSSGIVEGEPMIFHFECKFVVPADGNTRCGPMRAWLQKQSTDTVVKKFNVAGEIDDEGRRAMNVRIYLKDFEGVRKKYCQLGREIEEMPVSIQRDNALHSHSKLGCFLGDVLGKIWRGS